MNKKIPPPTTLVDKVADKVRPIEDTINHVEDKLHKKLEPERRSAFKRFPKLFTILAAFGFVATLYGFERIIESWGIAQKSPGFILVVGLIILLATGTMYKKL